MWTGDQNVDFSYGDGLPSTIPAALNMGLSGVGITHYDIGGYTTYQAFGLVRTAELLLRSAEAAIFTPMFRSHEGIAQLTVVKTNFLRVSLANIIKLYKPSFFFFST